VKEGVVHPLHDGRLDLPLDEGVSVDPAHR